MSGPGRDDPDTSTGTGAGTGERTGTRAVGLGAGAGALLVAALAIPRLGTEPLWLDEAYSLGVVNQFGEGVRRTGGTMLGYYTLLWAWTRVGDAPAWLRGLSTLFAMVAMVPVAAIGNRIGGRRLAVVAPVLLAGAYMFQTAALEARAYTMEILVGSTCFYALIRAVQSETGTRSERWSWAALAVLAPLGVLIHGLFVLFIVALVVAGLVSPKPRRCMVAMIPMLATTGVVVAWLAWLGLTRVGHWIPPTDWVYLGRTAAHYLGGDWPLRIFTLLIVTGSVIAVVVNRRRGPTGSPPADSRARFADWSVMVLLVWIVLPPGLLVLLSTVRPAFVDRYVVAITPAVALLVGWGTIRTVDWILTRTGVSRVGSTAALVGITLVLVAGWSTVGQRNLSARDRADWSAAATLVAQQARAGDGILFYGDGSRTPFEAAWQRVPHPVTPVVIDARRPLGRPMRTYDPLPLDDGAHRRVRRYERVWVVRIGRNQDPAIFYELTGPLAEEYDTAGKWEFPGFPSPIRIRLYVRDGPAEVGRADDTESTTVSDGEHHSHPESSDRRQ